MTVAELIAKLEQFDSRRRVLIASHSSSGYEDILPDAIGTLRVYHNDNRKYCTAEYVEEDMLESDRLGRVDEFIAVVLVHAGV